MGAGEVLRSEHRVSVWQDEESSGDEWCWLLNNVNALNAIELYSENGEECRVYVHITIIFKGVTALEDKHFS